MGKSPFYFSENKIPIELFHVTMQTWQVDNGISFGFMLGVFEFENLVDIVPRTDENFLNYSFSFNEMLRNIELGHEPLLRIISLQYLSSLLAFGAVFLNNENDRQVLSIPMSLETRFSIEKRIADSDVTEDNSIFIAQSSFTVAQMLKEGIGVEENFDEAIRYYTESSRLDHPDSNYVLGVLLHQSDQLEESHNMFLRAAHFGHLNAQINVAVNYLNGEIVPQDAEGAYYWARRAENQGDEDGGKLVSRIKSTFTRAQIERLEKSITEAGENRFALIS